MSPMRIFVCAVGFTVTTISRPSRSSVMGTSRSARPPMARKKSSHVRVRWLPTLMMRSPGLMPPDSAGDPLVTTATSTGSLS